DLDGEAGALARGGCEFHIAANLLDVRADHIHPHTSAGDRGHFLGRGEAWPEDKLTDLLIRHACELFFRRQSVRYGLLPDPLDIDAAAVIADLDDDVPALVEGVQQDRSHFGLALREPL